MLASDWMFSTFLAHEAARPTHTHAANAAYAERTKKKHQTENLLS